MGNVGGGAGSEVLRVVAVRLILSGGGGRGHCACATPLISQFHSMCDSMNFSVAVPPKKRSALREERDSKTNVRTPSVRTPSPKKRRPMARESQSTPRSRFTVVAGLPKPRISTSAPEQRPAETCTTGPASTDRAGASGCLFVRQLLGLFD